MLNSLSLRSALCIFIAASLTACGGGSSDSSPAPAPTTSGPTTSPTVLPAPPPPASSSDSGQNNGTLFLVSGSGVKGPLANASVSVFEVDFTQDDLRGDSIASANTNQNAQIENLSISKSLPGPFFIEFKADAETVDLTTGSSPVIKTLITVVTKNQLEKDTPIYATPLTTAAVNLLQFSGDSTLLGGNDDGVFNDEEFIIALDAADDVIRSTLGFGISDQVDIFSTSAVYDNQISVDGLIPVTEYRAASEAFASVVYSLATQSTSQVTADDILADLARDLSDGHLDQAQQQSAITSFSVDSLIRQSNLLTDLTLAADAENRKIADIAQILIDERSLLGISNDVNTSTLQATLDNVSHDFLVTSIARNADLDNDGVLNSRDLDDDGDSVADVIDVFPHDQLEFIDTDFDGIGNNADLDDDGDGQPDVVDDFPLDATRHVMTDQDNDGWPIGQDTDDADPAIPTMAFRDHDLDGLADNGGLQPDNDDDNDGILDIYDAFPLNRIETRDFDGDGIGDNSDDDIDGDNVNNSLDMFPFNPSEHEDTDGDGIGNNSDSDDDNDGVPDSTDPFPLDSSEFVDSDGDGIGNNADNDDDNDGVDDINDASPLDSAHSVFTDSDADGWPVGQDPDDANPNVPSIAFRDTDQDGLANDGGLAPDKDDDNDGVEDLEDWAPEDPNESRDSDGDSIGDNADSDRDGDSIENALDMFPSNPEEWLDTDSDGVGNNEDTDDDNDGVSDSQDAFPLDASESADFDNDGIGNNRDSDDDNDSVDDTIDAFPYDPAESFDFDRDGIGNNADPDDDNDRINDDVDAFPFNPNESEDSDGDGVGDNSDTNIGNNGSGQTPGGIPGLVLPPPPNQNDEITVSGAGVKGPMAYANVVLYQLDMSSSDFKGEVVSVGTTNQYAQIVNLSRPSVTNPPYLLEITGVEGTTIDISTGLYPVIDELRTLVTQQMLDDGIAVYATPLTTIATDMALSQADSSRLPFAGNNDGIRTMSEVRNAIHAAAEKVKSTLGFGIDESVDIFTTPPIIDDNTRTESEKASVTALRSAVEAVSAIIYEINETRNDNNASTSDVLKDMTLDLADGEIDGQANGQAITAYENSSLEILQQDPATLRIPNTNVLVSSVRSIVIAETQDTGNDTVDTLAFQQSNFEFQIKPVVPRTDADNDGVINSKDAFPNDASSDSDFDNDGLPDIAYVLVNGERTSVVDEVRSDNDDDNDGVVDAADAFPFDPREHLDSDSDGIGNNADNDDDGDGRLDSVDDYPLDPSRQVSTDRDNDGWPVGQDPNDNDASLPALAFRDSDSDGFADAGGLRPDDDDDDDGIKDAVDAFPLNPSEYQDLDGDGIGNNADEDIDGDGTGNSEDFFPFDANESKDTDGDGIGDNRDNDDDNDGVEDNQDAFPLDALEHKDSDNDGVGDNRDDFPLDNSLQSGTAITELDIPDLAFKQCLLDSHNEDSFVELITSLNCSGRGIIDLSGIESLTQLKTITLEGIDTINDYSQIAMISGLESLKVRRSKFDNTAAAAFTAHPSLKHVDISETDVTELDAIATLPNLSSLYLWGEIVYDLAALQSSQGFQHLAINSRQISDINDLANLTNLSTLWLHGDLSNALKSIILGLPNLRYLSLGYSQTVDDVFFADIVSTHTDLVWLSLEQTAITNIAGVERLTRLSHLSLSNNDGLHNLSPLLNGADLAVPINSLSIDNLLLSNASQVTTLQSLGVSVDGSVTEMANDLPVFADEALNSCVENTGKTSVARIEHLDCTNYDISDLTGIDQLTALTHVNLQGITSISDYSPLALVSSLEYLEVRDSNFNNEALVAFENHPSLSHIGADCTFITNIEAAANIPNLRSLHLRGNVVYDISVLAGLGSFETLVLGSQQVTNVQDLTNLPHLQNLWFKGDLTSEAKSTILLLTGLKRLAIGGSETVEDVFFSDITNTLSQLTTLNVYGSSISNLEPVASLTNLSELVIAGNDELTDLSALTVKVASSDTLRYLNIEQLFTLSDQSQITTIRSHGVDVVETVFPLSCPTNNELTIVSAIDDGTNDGNVPAGAFDGSLDPSSRWSSEGIGKQITFDLGKGVRVSQAELAWFKGNERIAFFEIETSLNNKDWTTVLSSGQSNGTTLDLESHDLLDSNARFVRITGNGNSTHLWNSLVEAKFYGCM